MPNTIPRTDFAKLSDNLVGAAVLRLTGAQFINASKGNCASGDNDIYTVPTGKRAMLARFTAYNTAGTTTTIKLNLKSGGSYYQIFSTTPVGASSGNSNNFGPLVLEAGESLALNTSQAGINFWAVVVEYDSTVPIRSVLLGNPAIRSGSTLAAGDNTLYTCPAASSAVLLGTGTLVSSGGVICCANGSGSTRTLNVNVVPSGGSAGSSNKAMPAASIPLLSSSLLQQAVNLALSAGDFINVNLDANTSSQLIWVTVAEKT